LLKKIDIFSKKYETILKKGILGIDFISKGDYNIESNHKKQRSEER